MRDNSKLKFPLTFIIDNELGLSALELFSACMHALSREYEYMYIRVG